MSWRPTIKSAALERATKRCVDDSDHPSIGCLLITTCTVTLLTRLYLAFTPYALVTSETGLLYTERSVPVHARPRACNPELWSVLRAHSGRPGGGVGACTANHQARSERGALAVYTCAHAVRPLHNTQIRKPRHMEASLGVGPKNVSQ
eukprot:1289401-Pyramimonas_sp.AAC.1